MPSENVQEESYIFNTMTTPTSLVLACAAAFVVGTATASVQRKQKIPTSTICKVRLKSVTETLKNAPPFTDALYLITKL